jgi:hypothetical protein
MGDGSKQNKGIHLNFYSYSEADILRLQNAIKIIFGWNTTIHKHKKG